MRSYQCHIHYYQKGKFKKESNTACFAGVNGLLTKADDKYIYIDKFKEKGTQCHITRLIELINQITPCELIEIEKKQYIKVKLLQTYDQSLIVLNFIRNLWYAQPFYRKHMFFKNLYDSEHTDPLEILTAANKSACKRIIFGDHSNARAQHDLKVKTKDQLLAWKGMSTHHFLTT